MDIKLFIQHYTNLIICLGLVFIVPHLISWLFPTFWVDDPLMVLVGFVYFLGSWGLVGKYNPKTHHPEDHGFTEFGYSGSGKPLF
jgi:hypothetical protein